VSANRPPPGSIFDGTANSDFVLPAEFPYEADVWGQVRRRVESASTTVSQNCETRVIIGRDEAPKKKPIPQKCWQKTDFHPIYDTVVLEKRHNRVQRIWRRSI